MPDPAQTERTPLRLGWTGLVSDGSGPGHSAARFTDAVLRGVAQVIFVNNAYTGLLCLLGILLAAPLQMAAALLCTALGTATGHLLKAGRADLQSGLYGYNGCLIGLAVPLFLGQSALVWALMLPATVLTSLLMRVLLARKPFGLPALTAPFVLCTWAAVLAMRAISPVTTSGPPAGTLRDVPVEPPGLLNGWPVVEGALTAIGQVYLQPSPLSGLVIALAVLAGSRQMFLIALLAGLASATSATLLALPSEAVRTGLLGFNAVLAALALGLVTLRPGIASLTIALAIASLMPAIQMACGYVLIRLGLPTMSVPFIATTWLALTLLRPFVRLHPA